MNEILDKKQILFERDSTGGLIPKKVFVIGSNGEKSILMTPVTRGEYLKHVVVEEGSTTPDADKWIVLNKVVEPKFSEEEFDSIPKGAVDCLVLTVLTQSKVFPDKKSLGVEVDVEKKLEPIS